jgi:prefoldin subunit 5
MTLENKRGPNDLEEQIDMLTKQKEFLQFKCRQAGKAILELEVMKENLSKVVDTLTEENNNLKTMMGRKNGK